MSFTTDVSFLLFMFGMDIAFLLCLNVLHSGRLISTEIRKLDRAAQGSLNVLHSGRLISTLAPI